MINAISKSISKYLVGHNSSLSLIDVLKIEYSLQVILGELSKITVILLIFLGLNQLYLFLFSYAILFSTRPLWGGIHCKTYYSCLGCSMMHFTIVILFSALSPRLNAYFYVIFFIISLVVIYKCAPCVNKKRPIKNKKRLKILSLITLTFWIILFFKLSNTQACNCIFISTLLQIVQLIILNMKGVVFNAKINKYFFNSAT